MQSERDVNQTNDFADIKSAIKLYQSGYSRIDNFKYPEGVQLAVNFEIHFDAQLRRRMNNEPIMQIAQGEFGGRVGIWRLMDLFDKFDIKVTIFTPGRICELYPESLKEAVRRGHEVGNHMWEHRIPSEPELEKDHLSKATSAVEKLCGKRPVGSRSKHKLSLLKNEGYIYVSRDDFSVDDVPCYVYDSEGNCMLNFPFHFALDDAMYYYMGFFESKIAGQRPADPGKVYDIWLSAFRQLYKMGRHMTICLHNFVSGRALRVAMLERLLIEMKKMPRVWFPTYEEMARYCLDTFPPRRS